MIDKTSYRPISTLPNFSIFFFEKLIFVEINSFIEPKLSKYLADFHAKHNTQQDLKMIEVSRAMSDKGNKVGAIKLDLSKTFNTLNHNFLLCKIKACGFNKNTLTKLF